MSTRQIIGTTSALAWGVFLLGCADWDNPTALTELEAETEFHIEATRVETFENVEIRVHVTEGGTPLVMRQPEVQIESEAGGGLRAVAMEPEGDGYSAHVMFYEPGMHHLHFLARAERHRLVHEFGDHEIEVERQHQVIGPYWVELEVKPAPVLMGERAHVHFLVFDLTPDGTVGNPVGGLQPELEVHDPDAVETALEVIEEEAGEYEAEHVFQKAGVYELHLEIEIGAEHADGEFHVPVLTAIDDSGGQDEGQGGDDHGHGH